MSPIFPDVIDNHYRGHTIALSAFYFVTTITVVRSLIHILLRDGGSEVIASIPLSTFKADAADTCVLLIALLGVSQFLLGLIYCVVLWKYQSLVPLMYLITTLEYVLRVFLFNWKPIKTKRRAPGAIGSYVAVPILLILFWLS